MSYEEFVRAAVEETKNGGDPNKGLVFAVLALAEATRLPGDWTPR